MLPDVFVPTIENGEELCIRVRFSFFAFYFPRKIRSSMHIIHYDGGGELSYMDDHKI